jgi:hypothetical protein
MSQATPQDGAIIFADLIGKLDVLSTYCMSTAPNAAALVAISEALNRGTRTER